MLRASVHGCQLLFLTQVWHVIYGMADATAEIVATCHEDVLLLCPVVPDPQVTYKKISWHKISEKTAVLSTAEWKNLQYNKEQNYSRQLNSSSEFSNSKQYSLRITNITNYDSGTYKCILETSDRKYNESNPIALIVKDCPEQLEDAKFKKHRAELVLLCSLGLFYLLLIFFTCRCLKDNRSQDFHKSRKSQVTNSHRPDSTYRKNYSNNKDSNILNPHSLTEDFLQSVETHQQL